MQKFAIFQISSPSAQSAWQSSQLPRRQWTQSARDSCCCCSRRRGWSCGRRCLRDQQCYHCCAFTWWKREIYWSTSCRNRELTSMYVRTIFVLKEIEWLLSIESFTLSCIVVAQPFVLIHWILNWLLFSCEWHSWKMSSWDTRLYSEMQMRESGKRKWPKRNLKLKLSRIKRKLLD